MTKKEFTVREVIVLLEKMQDGIKVIGEQFLGIKKTMVSMQQGIADLKEGMIDVRVELNQVKGRVDKTNNRLDNIEGELYHIKYSLQQKTDQEDVDKIDKRVTVLERKI